MSGLKCAQWWLTSLSSEASFQTAHTFRGMAPALRNRSGKISTSHKTSFPIHVPYTLSIKNCSGNGMCPANSAQHSAQCWPRYRADTAKQNTFDHGFTMAMTLCYIMIYYDIAIWYVTSLGSYKLISAFLQGIVRNGLKITSSRKVDLGNNCTLHALLTWQLRVTLCLNLNSCLNLCPPRRYYLNVMSAIFICHSLVCLVPTIPWHSMRSVSS